MTEKVSTTPPTEHDRLDALRSYGVLDTPREAAFEEVVELAARMLGTPMAAVSLVDEDRQWFKAQVGLPADETSRDVSFCAYAIEDPERVLVVEDAAADGRFADNALVTGEPHIRAYAGVPLIGVGDQALGALCVIDSQPRQFSETELDELRRLARQVEALLELRRVAATWRVRAGDDRFSVAFRLAPLPMNLVGLDGRFLQVNDAMSRLCGRGRDDFVGRPVEQLIAADDQAAERLVLQRLKDGEIESAVRSGRVVCDDGSEAPVLATTSAIRDDAGELLFFLTSLEDVFQQMRSEDALALTHTALEAIIAIDSGGHIVFWNAGAATMFGHRPSEVMGRPVTLIMPERFRDAHRSGVSRLAAGGTSRFVGQALELTALRASGEEFPIELVLTQWIARGDVHYTAMIRDVTERQQLLGELDRRANVDDLTGLASKAHFAAAVSTAAEHGTPAVVVLLGLDRFRRINESLGYAVGDEVLRAVAQRVREAADGSAALVARAGGDQFALLVQGSLGGAYQLVDRVQRSLGPSLQVGDRMLDVTASVGLATISTDRAPRTAIREAETAMHRAKSTGRTPSIAVYDDDVRIAALTRLSLEQDLRQALRNGALELHYQPEFALGTGDCCAVEALVRWTRPGHGPVSPALFIPLAEETGLIDALGDWVIDRAVRDLASLQRRNGFGRCAVAVNVSAAQLSDVDLPARLDDALNRHGAHPCDLILELTETAVMSDSQAAQQRLEEMASLGARIAIDDFGTGYSSLARLQELPVSILKIDKRFIDPLPSKGHALVAAVVALASSLGLSTVAEGVETPSQLALLAELGVDIGQGFYLARPAPLENHRRYCMKRGWNMGGLAPPTGFEPVPPP